MATSNSHNMNLSRPSQKRMLVRNYLLIWMDAGINDRNEDCKQILSKFRKLGVELKICIEPTQCIQSIKDMDDRKAFVIASGALGQQLVPKIHGVPRVDAIYIFCGNKSRHEEWVRDWPKIEGVYTSIKPIYESMKRVVKQCEHDSVAMSFVPKETWMAFGEEGTPVDQLEPSYMYTMLFKEIILEITQDENQAVRDLVMYFGDKGIPKDELELLRSTYHEHKAIWWYTCETFLYGTLNQSLRNLDMAVMVKMGFFIKKLHLELKDLCHQQSKKLGEKFIVYRGQGMIPEDFQHLQDIKGGLLAFNCFVSTSTEREVALDFITRNLQRYKENVGVLFHMTIDQTKVNPEQTPFAAIQAFSASKQEDEILFSMHTVFLVNEIKQSTGKKRQWDVQLILKDDNGPELCGLMDYMKREIDGSGWFRMGKLMLNVGDFEQAEVLYNQLLEDPKNEDEREHIYHQFGEVRLKNGWYKEAIEYYEKSLEIKRKTVKEDDISLAPTYNNIALAYDNIGEYSEALHYYTKGLEISRQALPPNHPNLATSYNNIAAVYSNMGENAEALKYYKKSLKIDEMALPPIHPHLATSYNNIGLVYNNMGEYSKALEYYEKSMNIRQTALLPTHQDLATSYNNIGLVYNNMGEYLKAFKYYEKSLRIREKALPPTHSDLATSYSCIGGVYNNMGEYSKALEFHKKDLEIMSKSLPPDHPDLAFTYVWFGRGYKGLKDYSRALDYFERAIDIREKSVGEKHPNLATTFSDAGDVHRLMGDYEKALEFHLRALNIQENVQCNPLKCATTYVNLGETYREMKDYSTALTYYQKGFEIREKKLQKYHPDLAVIFHGLAKLYSNKGDNRLAMKNVQQAIEIGQLKLPSTHPDLIDYRRTLEEIQKRL